MSAKTLCIADVREILGDIEESKVVAIMALNATLADIQQAAVWAQGDGDFLAKSGFSQTAPVRQIIEILMADEEEFERR